MFDKIAHMKRQYISLIILWLGISFGCQPSQEPQKKSPFLTKIPYFTRAGERTRTYDIKHIKLDIQLFMDSRSFLGSAEITLSPLNPGFKKVELDQVDLKFRSITWQGQKLDFETSGEKLFIDLPRPFRAGEEINLKIEYKAEPI